MIICALDFQTSGLSFEKDRVIEVGLILFSTGLNRVVESHGFLVKSEVPVSKEVTVLTGITQSMVDKFGYDPDNSFETILEMFSEAEAIIGHNVVRFDKKMLESWAARIDKTVPEKLWIDTYTDMPLSAEPKSLKYMACDAGILALNSHGALADCETVLYLIQKFDFSEILSRAKEPTLVIKAEVTFDTNKLAKARKYRWNPNFRMWWKTIKSADLKQEH